MKIGVGLRIVLVIVGAILIMLRIVTANDTRSEIIKLTILAVGVLAVNTVVGWWRQR